MQTIVSMWKDLLIIVMGLISDPQTEFEGVKKDDWIELGDQALRFCMNQWSQLTSVSQFSYLLKEGVGWGNV